MMEKRAILEPGVTPSEVSGKPSEVIKQGQAVTEAESPEKNTVEKVASLLAD